MLKKPTSRYSFYLFLEFIVVLLVMGTFRVIQDRAVGGLIAGMIFLSSTLFILITEWWILRKMSWALGGGLLFFLGGVLPILLIRALTWGVPFDHAEIFGIRGAFFHRSSNLLFLFFLLGIFISLQKARFQSRRAIAPEDHSA